MDFINSTAINYNVSLTNSTLGSKFGQLIEQLHKASDKRVVILIDEYDKPLIDSLNKAKEVHQGIKETLHNFYQVIKGSDEHIKFMFMTGVSRFAGLSVFSALNNLYDITMDGEFSCICGYTQEELEDGFKEYIGSTAEYMGISKEELLSKIKYWYNGYSWDGRACVYNPFSTLAFFKSKEFKGYWFETGTPTFLIEQIRKRDDIETFTGRRVVGIRSLNGEGNDNIDTEGLLFQTGYLTIKEKKIIEDEPEYRIDFPNNEVKRAFISSLIKEYTLKKEEEVNGISREIGKGLKEKDEERLERSLKELYANIPYDLHIGQEKYYHSLFLLTMKFVGYEAEGEVHTDKVRIDVVLRKEEKVIVVEIKYAKEKEIEIKIEEAMNQIKEIKYYEKYTNTKDNVALLGIVFGEKKEIRCRFESLTA
jgi:hypothetical protein